MGPRWKGKGSEAKALADPMSKIVSQLQSSLIYSNAQGLLSGCSVLVEADTEQTELLNRACFGRPIITAEKDKQWFQLGLEETFYLCHSLKCLKIVGGDNCLKTDEELWLYMKVVRVTFPDFYKAYSHLRTKNWVVRSGCQYGVDFVAYRHHPALVHSEYAVLVLSEGEGNTNQRLKVWSDFQCTIRLCGSVAKTLLTLNVNKNGHSAASPSCLENYSIEERTITRWSPEQCRENKTTVMYSVDHCLQMDHKVDALTDMKSLTVAIELILVLTLFLLAPSSLLIAGGTGITSMLRVIKTIVKIPDDNTQVSLLYANVSWMTYCSNRSLTYWQLANPNLKIFYTVDNPTEKWRGGKGYISKDMAVKGLPAPSDDSLILVSPGIIKHISGDKAKDRSQRKVHATISNKRQQEE